MSDDTLRIMISDAGVLTLIAIEGEIDEASVLSIRAVFDQLSVDDEVLVDMAGVRFIDVSGLNLLIAQKLWMRRGRGSFHIANPSRVVRRIVETAGFSDILFGDPEPPTMSCA